MLPTPDLSHLTKKDYETVYEPAEDTFLFLDALEEDAAYLRELNPLICLEIGYVESGDDGRKILGPSVLYLCSDINSFACQCTYWTGQQNNVLIDPVNGSLAAPFHQRLKNSVDVLLFNPPYVPTSEEEATKAQEVRNIEGSWAGGSNGMQVTDVLLDTVESLLSPAGRFYLVAMKQNNIPEICHRMLETFGLESKVVLQRRAGREHLFILRFTRLLQNRVRRISARHWGALNRA